MFKYNCQNPISGAGISKLGPGYEETDCMEDADVVLVRSTKLHNTYLPDKLTAIARAGAGVNNIPIELCAEHGIAVFNTPGANANGVKEMVLAGMLLASRDIMGGIEWVKSQKGNPDVNALAEKQKKAFAGCEINGRKLGIIGLGAIGQLVANAATHLGMDVYGYDPYLSVDAAWNLSRSIHHTQDLDDIYRECDYITIHIPLTETNRNMIDSRAIGLMKENVVILNFSRDLLVDEKALVQALRSYKVKKYVTDFANSTVVGEPGILVTPHLGASTEESEDNCAVMAVREVRDYMENGNIKNSVNYPACDMGRCLAEGRIAINHRNIANMLGQFTSVLGRAGINISDLTNKGKNDYAYTLIDVESPITCDIIKKLESIDGVLRVRIVK